MKFKLTEIILYFVIPCWIVAEALIILWVHKAKPDKNITDKYPKKIILLSQVPFGKSWKHSVNEKDIRLLQTYQHRIRVWYLSLMPPFFLILYIYTL